MLHEVNTRSQSRTRRADCRIEHRLGRGHAMALVYVIQDGPQIGTKHLNSATAHSDPSDMLWLDGKASNPANR